MLIRGVVVLILGNSLFIAEMEFFIAGVGFLLDFFCALVHIRTVQLANTYFQCFQKFF